MKQRYVVIPFEEMIHEPEFPGDEARTEITRWNVYKDVTYGFRSFTGEFIESFEDENDALDFAERMNKGNG